jgi:ADP-ribosyl-[dinitrogen reductase] hydrolase
MLIHERVLGVLLGTAIGDAIGLPFEGLPPERVEQRLARHGALRHSLVLGHGMISDDTEHACLTAHALIDSRAEPAAFRRALARRLRLWLLALPPATGLATARGILRLWLGWSPDRSGVDSAGNGPMMRAAVIGAFASDDCELLALIRASTRMTHLDPRAEQAAIVIARLAAARRTTAEVLEAIDDPELRARTQRAWLGGLEGASLTELRAALGFERGVTGFVNDTLPAVVFCTSRWPEDFRAGIEAAIRLGGDTDTVAAMVGALAGARLGPSALPRDWLSGIADWPMSVASIHRLAGALVGNGRAPRQRVLANLARNLAMLVVVLGHAVARVFRAASALRAPPREPPPAACPRGLAWPRSSPRAARSRRPSHPSES